MLLLRWYCCCLCCCCCSYCCCCCFCSSAAAAAAASCWNFVCQEFKLVANLVFCFRFRLRFVFFCVASSPALDSCFLLILLSVCLSVRRSVCFFCCFYTLSATFLQVESRCRAVSTSEKKKKFRLLAKYLSTIKSSELNFCFLLRRRRRSRVLLHTLYTCSFICPLWFTIIFRPECGSYLPRLTCVICIPLALALFVKSEIRPKQLARLNIFTLIKWARKCAAICMR